MQTTIWNWFPKHNWRGSANTVCWFKRNSKLVYHAKPEITNGIKLRKGRKEGKGKTEYGGTVLTYVASITIRRYIWTNSFIPKTYFLRIFNMITEHNSHPIEGREMVVNSKYTLIFYFFPSTYRKFAYLYYLTNLLIIDFRKDYNFAQYIYSQIFNRVVRYTAFCTLLLSSSCVENFIIIFVFFLLIFLSSKWSKFFNMSHYTL